MVRVLFVMAGIALTPGSGWAEPPEGAFRLAQQADAVGAPTTGALSPLQVAVRERAAGVGKETSRTALEALAAILGESCLQARQSQPGVAVLGFPNVNDVGLPLPEAAALRDEVKDALSRIADLVSLVPIDDLAATHDALETVRQSGSAETRAVARRTLDRTLVSSVDVVIHFSPVIRRVDGPTFQVNVVSRDGQCAQSRTVPLAPERLVSGDLRVIVDQAARATVRSPLVTAMGPGDALVVIPPTVEGRLQSGLWADAFAAALADAIQPLLVGANRHARADLIGAYGTLPLAEANRYLWLRPQFIRETDGVRFRLTLFPTEGDDTKVLDLGVTEAVVNANAWQSAVLDLRPAREPFLRDRDEVDYLITSRSRLSLYCHAVGSNGLSALVTPSRRTSDLQFADGALIPYETLDRVSLYELSDHRFLRRRIAAHVEMIECLGVPVLPAEARGDLARITQRWLQLTRTGGGIHPTGDVRALFADFPFFNRDWVARALGRIVETTRMSDRDRASAGTPLLRD